MNISRTTSNEPEPRFRRSEHVKRLFLGGLLAATTLAGGLAFASEVQAVQPEFICDGYSDGTAKIDTTGDPSTVSYTAPDGFLVDEYCVKASTVKVIVPVNPPSKTVIIDHPTVNSVSHYSVSWTPACETDPTIPASSDDCGNEPPPPPPPALKEAIPAKPGVTPPGCASPGSVVLPDPTVGYGWVKQSDGTYAAVADEGYFFSDDAVTTFDPGDLSNRPAGCETTTTVTVADPPAQIQVSSQSPVVPQAAAPAAPAAAVSAVPTQLPATGSSSWVTALIALAALAGGTGLMRLSRRPTD